MIWATMDDNYDIDDNMTKFGQLRWRHGWHGQLRRYDMDGNNDDLDNNKIDPDNKMDNYDDMGDMDNQVDNNDDMTTTMICSDCKNTVFCMMEPSLMNQNEISLEVTNALIARILFYVCWDIVWCIKTNFLFKYCMQWLQEYCFLHDGTFSDESKWN